MKLLLYLIDNILYAFSLAFMFLAGAAWALNLDEGSLLLFLISFVASLLEIQTSKLEERMK